MFQSVNEVKRSTILTGFLVLVLMYIIPGLGLKYYSTVIDPSMSKAGKVFVSRLLFWLWLVAVYLYSVKIEKQPFLLWTEKEHSIVFYILSILLIVLLSFLGNTALYFFLIRHGYYPSYKVQEYNHLSIPVKLLTILTAAFVEELIFRGYLLPRLKLFFKNIHMPIIISAILFGLAHASWGTVINVLGPLFAGLILGYHYYKYQNIKILIIVHFLVDSTLFLRH